MCYGANLFLSEVCEEAQQQIRRFLCTFIPILSSLNFLNCYLKISTQTHGIIIGQSNYLWHQQVATAAKANEEKPKGIFCRVFSGFFRNFWKKRNMRELIFDRILRTNTVVRPFWIPKWTFFVPWIVQNGFFIILNLFFQYNLILK